jgi:hypothetical protein
VSSWRIHNAATTIRQSMLYAGQGGVGLTVALNSAYSFGVSGAAFFSGFIAQESATLTDFWLFVNSFVGTWGSTDQQINVEIRHGLTNSNIPGSTLVGSFAITLTAGVTGWKKHTLGSPIMLQAGGFYTFVVADNDGSAANHVVMRGRGGASASLETMLAGVHPTGVCDETGRHPLRRRRMACVRNGPVWNLRKRNAVRTEGAVYARWRAYAD